MMEDIFFLSDNKLQITNGSQAIRMKRIIFLEYTCQNVCRKPSNPLWKICELIDYSIISMAFHGDSRFHWPITYYLSNIACQRSESLIIHPRVQCRTMSVNSISWNVVYLMWKYILVQCIAWTKNIVDIPIIVACIHASHAVIITLKSCL